MSEYLLEMLNISKYFPGVKALDGVSLKVRPGTVHALMGENGAGKSTLMKCLFGIYSMDSGEIKIDGKPTQIHNTEEALQAGIAMVHQELQPIPQRSIAENIFCGRYPVHKFGPFAFVDQTKLLSETQRVLDEVHLNFDPRTLLGTLSVSQMQSVEIAKAVSMDAKVVIMDEPTSSLTENEVEFLFGIINELRNKGCAIIYISHKMDEILRISDEVTIMRDGEYIGTWTSKDLTIDMIISKMVGRELNEVFPPKTNKPGEVVLEVKNFTSTHANSFKNASFNLRKGEILGFGGLVGAQRTELMEAIFGIRHISEGELIYKGKPLKVTQPSDAIHDGIALLTEDRRETGIFGVLSIEDNVAIASLDQYLEMHTFLKQKKIDEVVNDSINRLNIKTPSKKTQIQSLSGGNQQKVIIARWLANNPDILILDEPTRGIDVGAKYEIYTIMNELAEQGKSIIMISSEMAELIGMSDRIVVMCNGAITGELLQSEASQESIMALATQF